MFIDISRSFGAIVAACAAFIAWAKTTFIVLGDFVVSVFDLALTSLVVAVIVFWFVPWGGDDEDE